jgi:hypothetical protein
MNFIRITPENLEQEHICCAISNNRDCQVASKKAWLSARLREGLVFLKGDARGKCFIEYLPAERAWAPICADGYTYIDCFWVSGQFKGHGYSNDLLDACIQDSRAQGRAGLCVLSSQGKKLPFLSDPGYLAHRGFLSADTADPQFVLLYLPFDHSAPVPTFRACAKHPQISEAGFVLYYADQCPYTAKYVPLIAAIAEERGVPFKTVHLETAEQAQNAPTPFTSFTLFRDGQFVTNEILSEKKFLKLLEDA